MLWEKAWEMAGLGLLHKKTCLFSWTEMSLGNLTSNSGYSKQYCNLKRLSDDVQDWKVAYHVHIIFSDYRKFLLRFLRLSDKAQDLRESRKRNRLPFYPCSGSSPPSKKKCI
jgi:hypothetical protein